MVVASLGALLVSWVPGISELLGIHWMKMEDEMEKMELWIEEAQGFDDMRARRNDLLSVQKSMATEGWLALVDAQDTPDSMAAASSS